VHGRMYQVSVPGTTTPVEQHVNDFGLQWGGESELIGRVLNGVDPRAAAIAKSELTLRDNQVRRLETRWRSELQLRIPYDSLPLQDGVDLVVYLVTMTSVGPILPVWPRSRGGRCRGRCHDHPGRRIPGCQAEADRSPRSFFLIPQREYRRADAGVLIRAKEPRQKCYNRES